MIIVVPIAILLSAIAYLTGYLEGRQDGRRHERKLIDGE